jgi:hypothetical protein
MNDNALIKNCDTKRTSDFVSANKTCGNCCVDLHSCAAKDNQYTAAKYIELFCESENPSRFLYKNIINVELYSVIKLDFPVVF